VRFDSFLRVLCTSFQMRYHHSACLVLGALFIGVQASSEPSGFLTVRAVATSTPGSAGNSGGNNTKACIPQLDPNKKARADGVAARDAGFIYGPSLIGQAAFFPNGTLGNARSAADMELWGVDRQIIDDDITADVTTIQAAITSVSC
jgi:hypothetical protein